jgi:hypothetical protein
MGPNGAGCKLDDSALRAAAADLLAEARRQVPAIGFALQAVARGLGSLTVEVVTGPSGVFTAIVFGADKDERERVLVELGEASE